MKLISCKNIKNNASEIDENGNIWSNLTQKFLRAGKDKDGYLKISLRTNDNKTSVFRIATLVLYTYGGPPSDNIIDPTVNHIDSDILNNNISNLEWLERGENSSIRKNKGAGETNHEAVLSENDVIDICDLIRTTNMSFSSIANIKGVDKSTINNIVRKKNWENVTSQYEDLKKYRKTIRGTDGRFYSTNPYLS